MNPTNGLSRSAASLALEDEDQRLSMAHGAMVLWRERWLMLAVTVLGTAISVGTSLLLPRYYTASTILLPPQQPSGGGALAQLGSLAGMAGAAVGAKTPDEMYVALLRTRRLQAAVIDQLGLKTHYESETVTDTRKRLNTMSRVSSDKKTGLITIEVDDLSPEFAARLANAHVNELRRVLATLAVTEAQQRRAFLEQQVNKTSAALAKAELAFRKIQAENGMVVSQALAESDVKAGVELRARIAAREVELQSLSRFATPQSTEVQRVSAELMALRNQLSKVESGNRGGVTQGATEEERGTAAVQAFRNVKVLEAGLEALVKQLEIAKVDESREGPLLQQVDVAVPPELPSKPSRVLVVVGGLAVSMLIGAFLAMGRARARPLKCGGSGWPTRSG